MFKRVPVAELARHADCLRVKAFNSRMISLVDKGLDWIVERTEELLANPETHPQAGAMVKKEVDRSNLKVWFVTVFQRGVMLELLVTIFALSCHTLRERHNWEGSQTSCDGWLSCPWLIVPLDWSRVDGQILFSVCISYLCYLKAVVDNFLQWQRLRACQQRIVGPCSQQFSRTVSLVSLDSLQSLANLHLTGLLMGCVIALIIFFHVTFKFIAAFKCESSFWDLPFDPSISRYGCVKNSVFEGAQ